MLKIMPFTYRATFSGSLIGYPYFIYSSGACTTRLSDLQGVTLSAVNLGAECRALGSNRVLFTNDVKD